MGRSYGMHLPRRGQLATGPAIRAVARRAEEAGFTSLWAGEHVVIPAQFDSRYPYSEDGSITWSPTTPYLDPLIALTWAAAATDRACLGTAILLLGLRDPIVTAKTIATLDHLTEGRFMLGVGAGWLQEEFEILGKPFAERGPRLSEAIEFLKQCWSPGPVAFEGAYFSPPPFFMEPKPRAGRDLPVLCGGKTHVILGRVAAVADGWMPSHISPQDLRSGLALLEGMAKDAGRRLEDFIIAPVPGREVRVTHDLACEYFDAGATTLLCDADYEGSIEDALRSIESLALELRL